MQKFCQYCGAQYEGRADSRFCSDKCRSAFNNRRRKREIGDLDGSEEDEPVNGYEDEDEPVNGYDDDEDEPINGYNDEDTADEDTENDFDEEEDDDDEYEEDEDDEEEDDEEYDNLLAAYEHEKNVSSALLQNNAKLATSEGNLKRENYRLKQQLGDLRERVERYQTEVGGLHRELSETKDQLTKALTAKPTIKPEPEPQEDEDEEKDDFLSLICDYDD